MTDKELFEILDKIRESEMETIRQIEEIQSKDDISEHLTEIERNSMSVLAEIEAIKGKIK